MTNTELTEIRESLSLTRKDFAVRLSISPMLLGKYEEGSCTVPDELAEKVKGLVVPQAEEDISTLMEEDNSLPAAISIIFGADRIIVKRVSISGGDINDAYVVTLDDGTVVFMKANKLSFIESFRAEALDSLGICFDRTDHPDRPATTMEVCADVDAVLDVHICKNLFLCNRQKTNFYLLIMPGDKPFKTKELSKQMGISRLSFADEKYMEQFLDIHPGSVSVLGLMNDTEHRVKLVIDEDVLKEEMFGCHPCENTSSIRFRTTDLTEKILPALNITPTIVHLVGVEE